MLGGSEALYEVTGSGWEPVGEHVHEQLVMTLRRELSEARLAEMWSSGRRMPLASLVAYAVEFIDSHIAVDDAPTRDREPTFTLQERPVRAPTNLPRPASSFVGGSTSSKRCSSASRLEHASSRSPGPGGTGKTRLALEAAPRPEYKAGVFWVGLASLRDPALVTETIAQTLGAKDGLAEHIAERELLTSPRQPGAGDRRGVRALGTPVALPQPHAPRHEP